MLLLIDHLALRARNYEYLIRLFQEWEVRVATSCHSMLDGLVFLRLGRSQGPPQVPLHPLFLLSGIWSPPAVPSCPRLSSRAIHQPLSEPSSVHVGVCARAHVYMSAHVYVNKCPHTCVHGSVVMYTTPCAYMYVSIGAHVCTVQT